MNVTHTLQVHRITRKMIRFNTVHPCLCYISLEFLLKQFSLSEMVREFDREIPYTILTPYSYLNCSPDAKLLRELSVTRHIRHSSKIDAPIR